MPLLAALLLVTSCASTITDTPDETIALTDEDNFAYDYTFDITSYPAPELSDFTIDWSALTEDMHGAPLVPDADINMAAVVVFRYLSEEDIESGEPYISWGHELFVFAEVNGATSVRLSDLTMFGTDIDIETYFEASYGTWLLVLSTGDIPGAGTRMAA